MNSVPPASAANPVARKRTLLTVGNVNVPPEPNVESSEPFEANR
jgi:hypothetical protein